MADKEQHNGRMLFTDFDASDKGRPVPVFARETAQAVQELPPPPPTPNVPTLDELVARLELDFEDDGEEAPPSALFPPEQPAESPAQKKRKTAVLAPVVGDSELALAEVDRLKRKTGVYTAPLVADAPSWDALTSAYEQARPVENLSLDEQITRAFGTPASAASDEAVDVLSMLDEWLEQESRPLETEDGIPFPDPQHPPQARRVAEARPVPYGGVERVEDWFAPPENQPDPVARVEDWFSPPEGQPDDVKRVADWFAPPEASAEEKDDPGETKVDISWLSDFRNELPAGDYWRKKTTRIVKKTGGAAAEAGAVDGPVIADAAAAAREAKPRPPAANTMELFADMDFDSLWEQKVESRQQSQPARNSDTRRIDLFDALDIDSLWSARQAEKRARAPSPEIEAAFAEAAGAKTDGAEDADSAGKTIIVTPEELSGVGAAVMPENDSLDVLAVLDEATTRKESQRLTPAKSASAASAPKAAPEPEPQAKTQEEARERRQRRTTAVAALDVPAGLSGPELSAAFPEAENAAGGGAPGVDALVEEAAGMEFDGSVFGDGSGNGEAGGDGEREYAARKPPSKGAPKKRGLTTDDLLNDIDRDGYVYGDGTGDVSAPVIDDSAIDEIARPSKSGTAEMRAVAGDGGEEEAEERSAPDSVAVNPMDVFADLDNMDFSGDMDDDMRAMLDDGEAADEEGATEDAQAAQGIVGQAEEVLPTTKLGMLRYRAGRLARRVLPMTLAEKALGMIAWRENWWFYCDLVAAVMASASLAVILSYLFWYRGT